MELHNYTLKFIFLAFFAIFSAAFGWNGGVEAAQPIALKKFLNDMDRDLCRKFKKTCKVRSKNPAAKRQKPIAEKPESTPPIPVQKPLVTQDVAAYAPIPRAKPQSLQKQAAILPDVSPGDTQPGKADKLVTAAPLHTQRPVIAPKAMSKSAKIASAPPIPIQKSSLAQEVVTPAPIPRTKPQELQQQAVLIPRVLPKETPPSDDNDTCLQKLRAAGTDFTVPTVNVGNGKCYVQNPVNLHSVKAQKNLIKLPEGPLFNCKFALQFSKWLSESGAPILAAQLGTPVEKISTGPGFECRGRNGEALANLNKISEHGFGNAVDITTLHMHDGRVIEVQDAIDPNAESYAILHGLRASACGYFTTVLGPGSNAAHAKHFHFDMGVHGKSGNYRICE